MEIIINGVSVSIDSNNPPKEIVIHDDVSYIFEEHTIDNPKIVKSIFDFEGKKTFTGVVKDNNGDIANYVKGKLHNESGPAFEYAGIKFWCIDGEYHCDDGPAIRYPNGNSIWYLNGKLHRKDGPACEYIYGDKTWYLNGQFYGRNDDFTNESWICEIGINKYTKDNPKLVNNVFYFMRMETFTGVVKDKDNTIAYYLNGKRHREGGPAVEYFCGDKEWWLNHKLHRTDGAAIEFVDGKKSWFLNGNLHRENGPAIERANGSKDWHLNGKCYGYDDDFTNESWISFVATLVG